TGGSRHSGLAGLAADRRTHRRCSGRGRAGVRGRLLAGRCRAGGAMKLIIAPLHEVAGLAARHQPSHLISLASPGHVDAPLAKAPSHRLDLRFNDIAEPREGLTTPTKAD